MVKLSKIKEKENLYYNKTYDNTIDFRSTTSP